MKNKVVLLALAAMMILCTAATCSAGDDELYYNSHDGSLNVWGTTWEATSFQENGSWRTAYDSGRSLRIVFRNTTYEASYATHNNGSSGSSHSVGSSYYGGDCEVQGRYIYCYDGNSRNERIRMEVIRIGLREMEANVYLPSRNDSFRVILNQSDD